MEIAKQVREKEIRKAQSAAHKVTSYKGGVTIEEHEEEEEEGGCLSNCQAATRRVLVQPPGAQGRHPVSSGAHQAKAV